MFHSDSKSGFSGNKGVVRDATEQEVAEYVRSLLKQLGSMIWQAKMDLHRRAEIERNIACFEAYLDREYPPSKPH